MVVPWLSRLPSWREEPRSLCAHQAEWLTCWGPTAVSSRPDPAHHHTPGMLMGCHVFKWHQLQYPAWRVKSVHSWSKFHWLNCRHYLTTFGLSHICTRQWCVSWRSGQVQVGGPGVPEVPPTRRHSGPTWCALWLLLFKFAVWYFLASLKCPVRLFIYFTHCGFSKCTDIWCNF